jgi:hypothetical protein
MVHLLKPSSMSLDIILRPPRIYLLYSLPLGSVDHDTLDNLLWPSYNS